MVLLSGSPVPLTEKKKKYRIILEKEIIDKEIEALGIQYIILIKVNYPARSEFLCEYC